MSWLWKSGEVLSRSQSFCRRLGGVMGTVQESLEADRSRAHAWMPRVVVGG